MKTKPWKLISTSTKYQASIFRVEKAKARSLATGREYGFDILVCPDWVNVVALTSKGNVVLVRQYRHGTREMTLEIPGGQIDPGEQPLEAAKRELAEETGYQAENWELIGMVQPNPAFQTNKTYTYLARDAIKIAEPTPDENEEIEVQEEKLSQLPSLISTGIIKHALVLCAFLYLSMRGTLELDEKPSSSLL